MIKILVDEGSVKYAKIQGRAPDLTADLLITIHTVSEAIREADEDVHNIFKGIIKEQLETAFLSEEKFTEAISKGMDELMNEADDDDEDDESIDDLIERIKAILKS